MPDVFGFVNSAFETAAKLMAIEDKIANAELRNANADLMIQLANIKAQIAGLTEENTRLQTELKQERERKNQASQLIMKDGALFFQEPPPGKAIGPYCPNCKENRNRVVLMKDNRGTEFEQLHRFRCSECNSMF